MWQEIRAVLKTPRRLLEPGVVLAFAALQVLLGFFANRLLTRVASPADLGPYYLYTNVALWLTLPTAASYIYIWKVWPLAKEEGSLRVLGHRMMLGFGIQAAACLLGFWVLRKTPWGPPGVKAALLVAAVGIGQAGSQLFDQVQTLERKRVRAGLLALCGTPVRTLSMALAFFMLGPTLESLLLGAGVAALAVLFVSMVWFRRGLPRETDEVGRSRGALSWSMFALYALPFFLNAVGNQAAVSAERWGLARLSAGATAILVQALGFSAAVIAGISGPLSTYFAPLVSQAAATDPERPLRAAKRRLFGYLGLLTAVLALTFLGTTVLATAVTRLFFGPSFFPVSELLPWTVLGNALFVIAGALSLGPLAAGHTRLVNGSAVLAKGVYVVFLLSVPAASISPLLFSQVFAASNFLYLLTNGAVLSLSLRKSG